METDDVLVIGAGPFGLSIAAHLRARGIDHRVVGRPMDTWRNHMPPGMMLRSEPYGSDMAAPAGSFDVAAYCQLHSLDYVERLGPLAGERFLDYADWYRAQLVPDVVDSVVTDVVPADGGFHVSYAGEETRRARKVVVATGVLHYATMPTQFAGMPTDLVSHTATHHLLDRFAGRRVAMVGGGQSALETAALLHEVGAEVIVVARRSAITWLEPNPERVSRLGHVRRPVNKLCEGWHCALWNNPAAFRRLPADFRKTKARTVLGPAGAWWLKDRVDGVIDVRTGHQVRAAVVEGSGVRLHLQSPAGGAAVRQSTLDVDHVMCGTGFRVDVNRLAFLGRDTLTRVETLDGFPVLNRAGQSSLPGLFFAGAPAAASLGPSVRFIAGTHTTVRQLTRELARTLGAAPGDVGTPEASPSPVADGRPVYERA